MTAEQWAILLIVVLVGLALGILLGRRRQSGRLRERFGPEYDRVVGDREGDRRQAEAELAERTRRRERFEIKDLATADRNRYAESWRGQQLRFLDEPEAAIVAADRLVMEVMGARGYPVEDFEQRAADLSVDHPVVVQNYRAAHEIAARHATGQASTEDLRQAMVHYRALFEELLGIDTTDRTGTDRHAADRHAADRDVVDRNVVASRDAADQDAADRNAVDPDGVDRSVASRDAVDRSVADRDVVDRGAARRERQ